MANNMTSVKYKVMPSLVPRLKEKRLGNFREFKLYTDVMSR